MSHTANNNGTVICTIGGTLLSVFSNLHPEDLVKTCLLAAIGATVSYSVSLGLKAVAGMIKRKFG